jgi:8-oxo-dGTP diphosphatase
MERARMIVVKQGNLLVIKRTKIGETYWVFPGGKIEVGETIEDTLVREAKEELGVVVLPLRQFTNLPCGRKELDGQMEYFCICDIKEGVLGTGDGPEFLPNSGYHGKYDISWIALEDLGNFDLRPHEVRDLLLSNIKSFK